MLQFQSTCKYKAHVANACVHQQVSRKISWLCRFWCQVLQWSESVSFLCEILLRPFGPTPYRLIDIASPSSRHPAVSWHPDPGAFTTQISLLCKDGGGELNSLAPWMGYFPPGQSWHRLYGILRILARWGEGHVFSLVPRYSQLGLPFRRQDSCFLVLPPLELFEKGIKIDIPHSKSNHLGLD